MSRAIVLLSGGMDSTICLYWAKRQFDSIEAVTFDYMQRHQREIQAAMKIASQAKVSHKIIHITELGKIVDTALTRNIKIEQSGNIPNTYVPNRNLIFFSFASAYGSQHDIFHYVGGMCQTDYSGYFDCRRETLDSFEKSLTLSLGKNVIIHTPLMYQTKAASLLMAKEFDNCIEALALSHTCYYGGQFACGKCPACKLRLKGFREAGIVDPIEYDNLEKMIIGELNGTKN